MSNSGLRVADDGTLPASATTISMPMTILLAAACGLLVAGNYFAQPLIGPIGKELGLPPTVASLIVTLTQLGYCFGILLLAPLGDLVENRRLVLVMLCAEILSLALVAWAPAQGVFLVASLSMGACSSAIQVLVTIGSHMSRPEERGRVVGRITSGLLAGILLARPLASLVTAWFGWHALFATSAIAVSVMTLALMSALPRWQPQAQQSYPALLGSLWSLLRSTPVLRRRAACQAAMFAAFSLFWTAVPMLLTTRYGMSQQGIALFALAGAGGALVAPLAGKWADRGWSRRASTIAMCAAGIGFAVTCFGGPVWLLAVAAILIDAGVQGNHVISQRTVLVLNPAVRSRLNSLYIALFFLGGALGSAFAGPLFSRGWWAVAALGVLFPLIALCVHLTEPRTASVSNNAE